MFGRLRGPRRKRIKKSDLALGVARKTGMMLLECPSPTRPAPPAGGADVVQRKAGPVAPSPRDELSPETQWMLSVRDARDREAFGKLFDHFAPRLKGFVMRNGISAAMAEDIVQDAMLKVWQRAEQFDPTRAQVSGWIYQITRNQFVDNIRKEKRPIPEELTRPADPEPDATDALALEQETHVLRRALADLPDQQRQMIEKAYLGELSHSQIQSLTGLPLGTIKSRIRLALERLRHELKGTRA